MNNKKIWISITCIFLAICFSLVFNIWRDKLQKQVEVEESSKVTTNISSDSIIDDSIDKAVLKADNSVNNEGMSDNNIEEEFDNTDNSQEVLNNNSVEENEATNNLKKQTVNEDVNSLSEVKLDEYKTEPVPDGKPLPVEWNEVKVQSDKEFKCTLSVDCITVLSNLDNLSEEKKEIVPEDGVIFSKQEVTFYEGETVFNVLLREMKKNKIHMEYTMTPLYNSNFIEGIANLYEFDCGELSGWTYKVNGWSPNYGCSRYKLNDGDIVEWKYTCDLGRDIDAEFVKTESEE